MNNRKSSDRARTKLPLDGVIGVIAASALAALLPLFVLAIEVDTEPPGQRRASRAVARADAAPSPTAELHLGEPTVWSVLADDHEVALPAAAVVVRRTDIRRKRTKARVARAEAPGRSDRWAQEHDGGVREREARREIAESLLSLSVYRSVHGDAADAAALAGTATEIDPSYAPAWRELAHAQLERGNVRSGVGAMRGYVAADTHRSRSTHLQCLPTLAISALLGAACASAPGAKADPAPTAEDDGAGQAVSMPEPTSKKIGTLPPTPTDAARDPAIASCEPVGDGAQAQVMVHGALELGQVTEAISPHLDSIGQCVVKGEALPTPGIVAIKLHVTDGGQVAHSKITADQTGADESAHTCLKERFGKVTFPGSKADTSVCYMISFEK